VPLFHQSFPPPFTTRISVKDARTPEKHPVPRLLSIYVPASVFEVAFKSKTPEPFISKDLGRRFDWILMWLYDGNKIKY
jgi:hypothetical protein